MPPPTDEQLKGILRTVCHQNGVEYNEESLSQVVELLRKVTDGRLKGSLPRDVISILRDNAQEDGVRPVLTVEAVDLACEQFLAGLSPRYVNNRPSAST